jgi:hypothetical protein
VRALCAASVDCGCGPCLDCAIRTPLAERTASSIFTTPPPPSQVDDTSDEKLNLPLLQFHEEATPELPLLAVNFDPALVALLRETKYFLLAGVTVPAAAAAGDLRARGHLPLPDQQPGPDGEFVGGRGGWASGLNQQLQVSWAACTHPPNASQRHHTPSFPANRLQVTLYNRIQRTILGVERPLVEGKLAAVESALRWCVTGVMLGWGLGACWVALTAPRFQIAMTCARPASTQHNASPAAAWRSCSGVRTPSTASCATPWPRCATWTACWRRSRTTCDAHR